MDWPKEPVMKDIPYSVRLYANMSIIILTHRVEFCMEVLSHGKYSVYGEILLNWAEAAYELGLIKNDNKPKTRSV